VLRVAGDETGTILPQRGRRRRSTRAALEPQRQRRFVWVLSRFEKPEKGVDVVRTALRGVGWEVDIAAV
jgi:hypothetical protein